VQRDPFKLSYKEFSMKPINFKYVVVAVLMVAAGAALAGFPIVSPDMLAGLGMVPFVVGNTGSVEEIKRLIEAQGNAFSEFKRKYDGRFEVLENEFSAAFAGHNRPRLSGGAGDDGAGKKAFFDMLRTGYQSPELKSMQSGSDPQGGYLLPAPFESLLTKNLREISPMRQLAAVVPVGGSELKQVHSVGGTAYAWVGETTSRPETAAPELKQVTIPTKECYAMPGVTQNLLDDNVFDLEGWLLEELTEVFSDAEGDVFINGDGVAKPRGLFTYDTVSTADATRAHDKFQYIPTGASGSFHTDKADPLIKLVYAVKPRYRVNGSWLMSPEVLEAVRKFKSATSEEYIWQPALIAGQPSTLLGYPVFEDENLPAIAAGSLSVAFGDFRRAYTITDRSTGMLRDPYTQKPYVMFYAAKRVGGGAGRDTRSVKFLKFSAT
jgi:HK97 family phage major capsid protein